MPLSLLLPLPEGLEITAVSDTSDAVVVRVLSQRCSSCCPVCFTPSSAIHSFYRRKPADLPCVGRPLRLLLTVKKFFCRMPSCPRKIFTERLPDLVAPFSRLTIRLRSALQEIGFAIGGKGGERLAGVLGMCVTDTTLLWSLFLVPAPAVEDIHVVGIDDWAWRRGKRYGTILVDQEKHQVIDLLADRSVDSAQAWFEAHADVEVVSRDRGKTYAEAATQGVPLALQVCDRWHLCKNVGEAVEAFLVRTRVQLPAEGPADADPAPAPEPPVAFSAGPRSRQRSQDRLQRKWQMVEQVQDLRRRGASWRWIADHLGLARNTVRKYGRAPADPPRQPPARSQRGSLIDRFEPYLLSRWREGCQNATWLFGEIQAQGYQGSLSLLRLYCAHLRKHPEQANAARPRKQRAISASPRELRWLLGRRPEDLDVEEQERLSRLLTVSTAVQQVYGLLQTFLEMVRNRQHQQLRPWMEAAAQSGIAEMQSFVAGIEQDFEAVEAALRLPWSQGQTEGQVNKLKTLKRQMYGRAGFALLRQRMLHRA